MGRYDPCVSTTTPAVAIIPARLGSTRFPEKVLANRTGWPLIRHVWESARLASCLRDCVVATDDARVVEACAGFGARAVMTSAEHPNGTSRLSEAARALGLDDDEVVVNVQGDEPELDPALIDAAVTALVSSGAEIGTVASPLGPGQSVADPNIVKAVLRADSTALYFSRAPVPFDRDAGAGHGGALRHVGLYAYRAGFLHRYAALAPTPLETLEKLEQLRALEHSHRIAVAVMASSHEGIDTPEQYERFVARWAARR